MKTNTHFLRSILAKVSLLVLAGVMISSCIKDEITDCPPSNNVRLVVKTDMDAYGLPASLTYDRYVIDTMMVYVFDAQGEYVAHWCGGAYTEGQDYVVPLQLPPGEYQFAAVTNHGATCDMMCPAEDLETVRPSIDELEMCLDIPEGGNITTAVDDLNLGTLSNVVVSEDRTKNDFTIIIYPQTYLVNFTIIGLPAANQYELEVSDRDFMRTLTNEMIPMDDDFCYKCTGELVESSSYTTREASMSMYNLMSTKEMPFCICDMETGQEMFSADLIKMIEIAYENATRAVDFNKTYEFDVVISFTANLDVTVTVNGWNYSDENVAL